MLQSTHPVDRPRNKVNAEEAILNIVEDRPSISTRRLERRVGLPHSTA